MDKPKYRSLGQGIHRQHSSPDSQKIAVPSSSPPPPSTPTPPTSAPVQRPKIRNGGPLIVARKRLRNNGHQVVGKIANLSPSQHPSKRKRVPKSQAVIADVGARTSRRPKLPNDVLIKEDEVDKMLQSISSDTVELAKARLLKPEMQPVKKPAKEASDDEVDDELARMADELVRQDGDGAEFQKFDDELRLVQEESRAMMGHGLFDNSWKTDEVRARYAKERPDFHPRPASEKRLKKRADKHLDALRAILKTPSSSRFYKTARNIAKNSRSPFLTGMELVNMPRKGLYGYYGTKRGHLVAKHIRSQCAEQLRQGKRENRVIQFFREDYFSDYVLAPELIARLVQEDLQLSSLDKAYKEMEETDDYGTYVMDKEAV